MSIAWRRAAEDLAPGGNRRGSDPRVIIYPALMRLSFYPGWFKAIMSARIRQLSGQRADGPGAVETVSNLFIVTG